LLSQAREEEDDVPTWVRDAIWWHVYPLGFTGASTTDPTPDGEPRLRRLLPWLDHVLELGANGLLLGPVFASATHGYDTLDHFRVDPRLGTDADLDDLLTACRERGLRVLLDGVFNHVGRDHPAVREGSWLRRGADGRPAAFEGHDALVELDHGEPAVADFVVDVMTHWLARGIDGWRLDAAYAVPAQQWAPILDRVRERFPEAYLVGEVIHGDYAEFVRTSGVDSITQYELWKAIWSSVVDRNFHELAWTLERHDDLLTRFVPQTFVGNHDVTRIASRIGDERHLVHALVVLFTTAGTPSVYAGDEHAFRGVKEDRAGGDDAVRPEFPLDPAQLSSLGLPTFHVHQELIGLRRRHRWLHDARTRVVAVQNQRIAYETVSGEDRIVVLLDVSDDGGSLEVPGAGEVVAGSARTTGSRVELPAHGWAVLAG
jgi:cyclomaltodextrinase